MGFNSTLIIINDMLHEIKTDINFGRKVHDAICKLSVNGNKSVDISSGNCPHAATVIETHHADSTSLIAIGGNSGTVLSPYISGYVHHTVESQINILKNWADQKGYRLVRKCYGKKCKNG